MKIEKRKISDLKYDDRNARSHDEKNIKAITGSLKKLGQQKPIVVNKDNVVIAGNGTLMAASSLGWDEIDVVVTTLNKRDQTAYALADNRTAELAAWETNILSDLLISLKDQEFDINEIGFDDSFFTVVEDEDDRDADAVPDDVETRCKPGDLWLLGHHRLLCGDSTNIQHVERLMAGEKADMVFTDPPYGVNERTMRKTNGRSKLAGNHDLRPVIGDDSNKTAIDCFSLCASLGFVGIWWGANYYANSIPEVGSWLVWDKRDGVASDDNADCELAWVWNKKPARVFRHLWKGCIRASEKSESKVHPTQKPIALAEWCFEQYSNGGKTILDLFLGSGSTLIACEKTGRKCYGMEIDPHYCDVVIKRWEDFTGKKAKLDEAFSV